MKIASNELLQELEAKVTECRQVAEEFRSLPPESLQWRPAPDKWSVLECIEHLNRYGEIYLKEFQQKIRNSTTGPEAIFRSGWLGNYAANSMLPRPDGGYTKMPTQGNKNPLNARLSPEVLDTFIEQQLSLLQLLKQAEKVSLNKVRCKLTLPIITFKLGDTFRFIINHQLRHLEQARRVMQAYREQAATRPRNE